MTELYMQYGTMVLMAIMFAIAWLYMRFLHDKAKDSRLGRALLRLGQELKAVVIEVNSVYVNALKDANKDGKITKEEAEKARSMAIAKLKENYGAKGLRRLAKVVGIDMSAVDSWLGTQMEGVLEDMKDAKKLLPKE